LPGLYRGSASRGPVTLPRCGSAPPILSRNSPGREEFAVPLRPTRHILRGPKSALLARKSGEVPADILNLQTKRTLLRRHRLCSQPIIGPPMHPRRPSRERIQEARTPAKANSKFAGAPHRPISQVLGLARVSQATAPTAREDVTVEVQLRHPSATAISNGYATAFKPRTVSAEVTSCPLDRHALKPAERCPRPQRTPLVSEQHGISVGGDDDPPRWLTANLHGKGRL